MIPISPQFPTSSKIKYLGKTLVKLYIPREPRGKAKKYFFKKSDATGTIIQLFAVLPSHA